MALKTQIHESIIIHSLSGLKAFECLERLDNGWQIVMLDIQMTAWPSG